jgi:hypothetical protein
MTISKPSQEELNKSSSGTVLSRRQFVFGASAMLALTTIPFSKNALASAIGQSLTQLSGKVFDLRSMRSSPLP